MVAAKRFFCCCLCLLLLLGCLVLTACNKQPSAAPSVSYAELMNMMNRDVDSQLGKAIGSNMWWGANDGRLWTAGAQAGGWSSMADAQLWIASARGDGSDVTAMQLVAPESPQLQQKLDALAAETPNTAFTVYQQLYGLLFDQKNSIYPLLCESIYSKTGEEKQMQWVADQYTLCSIDAAGGLQRGPVLQVPEEYTADNQKYMFVPQDNLMAPDGSVWMQVHRSNGTGAPEGAVYLRFSAADGSCTGQVSLPDGWYAAAQRFMPDGSLLVWARAVGGSNDNCFYVIADTAAQQPVFGKPTAGANDVGSPLGFIGTLDGALSLEILGQTSRGIYRFDLQTGTAEELLLWENYGIGPDTAALFFTQDGQFMQFLRVSVKKELSMISLIDQSLFEDVPVVTLAVTDEDSSIKELVNAYNAAGPQVYVKAVDYSNSAARAKGFGNGVEMLQRDIVSNTAPDIVLIQGNMNTANYIRKGLFADLYPYIDSDPDISRSDFIPGVLNACEYNDTLPTLVPSYMLLTAAGAPDVVGDIPGWTWQEYNDVMAAYPNATPFYMYSRDNILLYLLQMGGSKFVDYSTGTANLNNPDFIRLLQASAAYPAESGDQRVDPKPIFAAKETLLQIVFFNDFRTLLDLQYAFDGEVVFKGFPGDDIAGSSAIAPMLRLGMTATCSDPDAAWAFMRTFLLPDYQQGLRGALPLRQDALEALAQAAAQPDMYASPPFYLTVGDQPPTEEQNAYFQRAMTAQEIAQVNALVNSAAVLYQYDGYIAAIVQEEADAFYNGSRTAEEAAAIMQNRAQTYMDEQG